MTTIFSFTDVKRILLASVLVAATFSLTACFDDNDTPIENAAEEVSEGVENAAEELDPNRTTGEKIGDAVEDAGQDIQDAAQ